MSENLFWKNEEIKYSRYSIKNNPFSWYYPEKMADQIRIFKLFSRYVQIRNAKIFEPGCGTGILLSMIAEKGAKCVGLDSSIEACRFAHLVSNHYLSNKKCKNLKIINGNFFEWKDKKRFDIVFNVGVLEHYSLRKQRLFTLKMKNNSKKYVVIAVPNYNSPIFKTYLKYGQKIGRLYKEKHLEVNVEQLFADSGIELVEIDGIGVSISPLFIDIAGKEVADLQKKFFSFYPEEKRKFLPDEVPLLAECEEKITKNTRLALGFSTLYVGRIKY